MKKYLFLLMAVFAIALTSCGNGYGHHKVKVGQEIIVKSDMPCAPSDVKMWHLHDLVIRGKHKEAMEMRFLGEAYMIEASTKVKVLEVAHDKEYCKVRFRNDYLVEMEQWVYIDDMFER